jgi:hypothetical protein
MLRCHFKGANRSYLAIVLNCQDHILKSIKLNEFLWRDFNLLLLTDIAVKFLFVGLFVLIGLFSRWFSLSLLALSGLLKLSLRLSGEVALVPIDVVLVLIVEVWRLLKEEIVAQTPVELLHRELEVVLVSYRHCHIVVIFYSCF